jgi:ABC-2 type transport system ATP-binding protein
MDAIKIHQDFLGYHEISGGYMIELDNIRVVHGAGSGAREAVSGVSLTIGTGELFGLLGPNGAGKTSLVSVLTGLRAPTSGRVILDGRELGRDGADLRKRIGLAPQETALYPAMTGLENMRFFGSLFGLKGPSFDRSAMEILEALGLAACSDRPAETYSGGMLRRLNLAVALAHEPDILFLDEPTVGVDPQSRALLFSRIRDLHGRGRTIVYTSHHLEEVEALCPRLAIMDHGRLIACDTLSSLLGRMPGTIRAACGPVPSDLAESLAKQALGTWTNESGGFRLECPEPAVRAPAVLERLIAAGIRPASLEVRASDLHSVFLSLTGRELRDG